VAWCDFRCHIPGCDGEEAIYNPEWLSNAVPFEKDAPKPCERYNNSISAFASIAGPLASNGTNCTADIFDNTTTVGCEDWVFETKERTIVNEVTFVYLSDRFKPYINIVQFNSN
jgi:hypothetical protein